MQGQSEGKLTVLTRYEPKGASSRLRLLSYKAHLERAGFDVTVNALLSDDYIDALYSGRRSPSLGLLARYAGRVARLAVAKRDELFWIEKEALPWVPFLEEVLLSGRVRFALDVDDAWMLRYADHQASLVRMLLGGKLSRIASRASLVIAANRHMEAWARESGAKNVVRVPTVVDASRYLPAFEKDENPRIVWIGTPLTARYLEPIAGVLAEVCNRHGAILRLIGAGKYSIRDCPVEHFEWTEGTENELIRGSDIGIMPLPDSAFERGKSGYKLIQYMACGLPVIGSRVGANADIVSADVGMLAGDPAEWRLALDGLLSDAALRSILGRAGRQRVAEHYSLETWGPRLAQAFVELKQYVP